MALYENSDYGRRLLPSVLDVLAKHNPDRLYAAIPRTGNISDGFSDVTVADSVSEARVETNMYAMATFTNVIGFSFAELSIGAL